MSNPFPYTLDNKRYQTWNYYLRKKFGTKVYKVPLSLGMTCPNRDGTKGVGGCTFCWDGGGGTSYQQGNLERQFQIARQPLEKKWADALTMPYFQSYSNTYVPVADLREALEEAQSLPHAIGVCIATRPDCLSPEVVDLLAEVSTNTFLLVELGLQTIHEETAHRIHRGHSFQEFLEGYHALTERKIPVCIHLINGLPGETKEMMLETVQEVAALSPHSVKLHMLHILKDTTLGREYLAHPFPLLTREEYVDLVCDQLELLPMETVIQRVTGDPPEQELLAPPWTLHKLWVHNAIDKELVRRNSHQGKHAGT